MRNLNRKKTTVATSVLFVFLLVTTTGAQPTSTETAFTANDTFSIQELNGNIKFGFNGTYTQATMENNTWRFRGLKLDNAQVIGSFGLADVEALEELSISAHDSNVTIFGAVRFNNSLAVEVLMYTAEGFGSQTVNLELNTSHPVRVAEWSVVVNDRATFLAEGSGWKLLDDNTVLVSVGEGNITVMHFDFGDSSMANLSFLLQHYVAILTGVVLLVVVLLAAGISVKKNRNKNTLPTGGEHRDFCANYRSGLLARNNSATKHQKRPN